MLMPDDAADSAGALERLPRRFNHRDYLSGRRQQILQQKQTDALPELPAESAQGKTLLRQFMKLREEHAHLQQQLADAEQELATIHRGHLQEIENYQQHITSLMAERDRLQEQFLQAEQRYQEMADKFESAAEEEALKLLTAATQTTELRLDNDAPTLEEDLKKTVKLHIRQVEDQHIAQALYLARQAQHKAALLEAELARERQKINEERAKLYTMQNTLREQAEQRRRMIDAHLRAKYAAKTTLLAILLLVPFAIILFILAADLHVTLILALIVAFLLCLCLSAVFLGFRSSVKGITGSVPHKVKK
jgi:transposase